MSPSHEMTARERVLVALCHQEADRVPIDLDGMRSTGIVTVAYNRLRRHLGITCGLPQVYDVTQQLARPEPAILDRFAVDVRPLNRLPLGLDPESEAWKPWPLPAEPGVEVLVPAGFSPVPDDKGNQYLLDSNGRRIAWMPAGGLYFDSIGHPLAGATTVAEIEAYPLPGISDAELAWLRRQVQEIREKDDRAIVGEFGGSILEAGQALRGWDRFLLDLVQEPKLAHALMEQLADRAVADLEHYLQAVGDQIDLIQMGDDLGTQHAPQIGPALYRRMIKPYHRRIYEHVKAYRTDLPVCLHSCGAIYPLIPDLIEAGVDVLNPVQISAAGMDPVVLKRDFGRDLAFWGGGCDTQMILPRATPEEVRCHVRELLEIWAPGGGYVFAQVHNIQPDAPVENVVAAFEAALEFGRYDAG